MRPIACISTLLLSVWMKSKLCYLRRNGKQEQRNSFFRTNRILFSLLPHTFLTTHISFKICVMNMFVSLCCRRVCLLSRYVTLTLHDKIMSITFWLYSYLFSIHIVFVFNYDFRWACIRRCVSFAFSPPKCLSMRRTQQRIGPKKPIECQCTNFPHLTHSWQNTFVSRSKRDMRIPWFCAPFVWWLLLLLLPQLFWLPFAIEHISFFGVFRLALCVSAVDVYFVN